MMGEGTNCLETRNNNIAASEYSRSETGDSFHQHMCVGVEETLVNILLLSGFCELKPHPFSLRTLTGRKSQEGI